MAISKKIRFEVFKRDKFTCQYCGKHSPDVILEVDHIQPKSKKGGDDMLNLVTSCFDCNRGKKDRLISDLTIVEKQREQLKILAQKNEQLEMLLNWRSGLMNIEDKELAACVNEFEKDMAGDTLNEYGKFEMKKILKRYGIIPVLEAIQESKKYIVIDDNKVTSKSFNNAFDKMKAIAYIKSLPKDKQEEYHEVYKIKYALKNKFYSWNENQANIIIRNFLSKGYAMDLLKSISNQSENFSEWKDKLNSCING